MQTLFLIHVEEDRRVALDLAIDLETAGYHIWCYETDNPPGPDYVERMLKAVEAATVIVVLISPRTLAKRDQVDREVYEGRGKWFIPLLWDLTQEDYEESVPKTWKETFRLPVVVSLDPNAIAETTEQITRGLQDKEIYPDRPDPVRIDHMRRERDKTRDQPGLRPRRVAEARRALVRWATIHPITIAVALLAFGAALFWMLPPGTIPVPGGHAREPWPVREFQDGSLTFNLWIEDAELAPEDDGALRTDYQKLTELLEGELGTAFKQVLHNKPELRIFRSAHFAEFAEPADCATSDARKKCVERAALTEFGIHAKVWTKFSSDKRGRQLLQRIHRVIEGRCETGYAPMPPHFDEYLNTLAKEGAKDIVAFVAEKIYQGDLHLEDRIDEALHIDKDKTLRKDFEGGLGLLAPSAPQPTWFALLARPAWGQRSPVEERGEQRDVAAVLNRFERTLESSQPENIAPVFVDMSQSQKDSLQRYFDHMEGHSLKVEFVAPITIDFDGVTATASFLRVDKFRDKETHEDVELAVRLVAVLVKVDGEWKIQSLKKPS